MGEGFGTDDSGKRDGADNSELSDSKIKAPPSVGVLVVGLPGLLALLYIQRGGANAKISNLFNNKCAVAAKELALEPSIDGSVLPDFS